MPIYIAKTYDGNIESVIFAKNEALAYAFWQGQGIYAHSIEIKTEDQLKDHPTGVLPIIKTKIKKVRYMNDANDIRIICNK